MKRDYAIPDRDATIQRPILKEKKKEKKKITAQIKLSILKWNWIQAIPKN